MPNLQELQQYKNIHMIGIGGSSMSGIAEILKKWNFNVTGSDSVESEVTNDLIANDIPVYIGSNPMNVDRCDLVVYSAAIKPENPELVRARELGIPTVERKEIMGELTRAFRNSICVSGTHGKSTTTSMIAQCFLDAKKDPTIQIGAVLDSIGGNYRVGESEYFIIEACEYSASFLDFFPKVEVILNIDNDHLDYYKTMENVKAAFVEYVKLLPDDGILVYNADDENCRGLSAHTKAKCVSFSTKSTNANFVAKNISYDANGCASFDVYKNNAFYKTFKLSVPGEHNIYDALACIAVCSQFDVDRNSVKNTLKAYGGAERRFQYLGEVNGAKVYDDYGHHPTEILAVANAVKKRKYNHSWVLFQPHTYSRTKALLDDFASVLTNFDNIIVTDIYAAREIDNHEVSSRDIIDKIEALGRKAYYIRDLESIVDFVRRNAKPDDIIIAQGAGSITKVGHELVQDPTSIPVSEDDCCGACAPVEEVQPEVTETPVETVETSEPVVETVETPVEETVESVETQPETPAENNYHNNNYNNNYSNNYHNNNNNYHNNNYHNHHNHYNNYNNHNHDNNKYGNRFNH